MWRRCPDQRDRAGGGSLAEGPAYIQPGTRNAAGNTTGACRSGDKALAETGWIAIYGLSLAQGLSHYRGHRLDGGTVLSAATDGLSSPYGAWRRDIRGLQDHGTPAARGDHVSRHDIELGPWARLDLGDGCLCQYRPVAGGEAHRRGSDDVLRFVACGYRQGLRQRRTPARRAVLPDD